MAVALTALTYSSRPTAPGVLIERGTNREGHAWSRYWDKRTARTYYVVERAGQWDYYEYAGNVALSCCRGDTR